MQPLKGLAPIKVGVMSVVKVQPKLKVSVEDHDDSRVDMNPIYYCLVSCKCVVLRTMYLTYEREKILFSLANYVESLHTPCQYLHV